jgi:hypothetical protein
MYIYSGTETNGSKMEIIGETEHQHQFRFFVALNRDIKIQADCKQ